jgi:anti-anti-sigma factor
MTNELKVGVRRQGKIAILDTDGYLNGVETEKVLEAADALIEEGVRLLVLHLEKSPTANSQGISVLIEIIEKVKDLDGNAAFCCVAPVLAKTLKVLGLLKRVSIYSTEEEALASLSGE